MFEFDSGGGDKYLDGVQCGGNETNLLECKHDEIREHACYSYRDPGVSCGNSPLECISCVCFPLMWSCASPPKFAYM